MIVIVMLALVLFLGIEGLFPQMGNIKTALTVLLALSATTGLVAIIKKKWLIAAPCILWAILLFMFTLMGPGRVVAVSLLFLVFLFLVSLFSYFLTRNTIKRYFPTPFSGPGF
jgi:Na+/melibiose symporter-like transporter